MTQDKWVEGVSALESLQERASGKDGVDAGDCERELCEVEQALRRYSESVEEVRSQCEACNAMRVAYDNRQD